MSRKYLHIAACALALIGLIGVAVAATPTPTPTPVQPYRFVTSWGGMGTGDGQFMYISDMAVDRGGNVLITDQPGDTSENRVQTFTTDGTFVMHWGPLEGGSLTVDEAGTVYHTEADRIRLFTQNGTPVATRGPYETEYGLGGITVDNGGNAFILSGNGVMKFAPNGTFLLQWGGLGQGNGEFDNPVDIAVDSAGNVYVVDLYNNRVQKFTGDGAFILTWGSEGSGAGEFKNPSCIAVDSAGNVYVGDTGSFNWGEDRVQKFTSTGIFVTMIGSEGAGDGQFFDPAHLGVDGAGNVYVLDYGNLKVQKFAPVLLAVPPGTALPTDLHLDGSYDDVNGNGRADFADIVLYFNQMTWIATNEPLAAFDYNGNGRIDFADVVWLFNHL